MQQINLGCGPVYVDSPEWLNLDFSPVSPAVKRANLLGRLPAGDGSLTGIYSSHFIEHVPKRLVPALLGECWRVLAPGGYIRLVLPDLENMVREYSQRRAAGEHDKADFVVVEMVDQCVRSESGGELGRLYRQLSNQASEKQEMIEYVRERVGETLQPASAVPTPSAGVKLRTLVALRSRIERLWIRLCLLALPAAFRAQNVSQATVGERHQWLWDFHQLRNELEGAGFIEVQRQTADRSTIPDFPLHVLDLNTEGQPRKGASLYVEARKPL